MIKLISLALLIVLALQQSDPLSETLYHIYWSDQGIRGTLIRFSDNTISFSGCNSNSANYKV